MKVKLFQVIKQGPLWAVFAVSASDPNDKRLVSGSLTSDEQFASDSAAELNRIAATHEVESGKGNEVNLSKELGVPDLPERSICFED